VPSPGRGRWADLGRNAPVGLLPFSIYTLLFLGLPTLAIAVGAFRKTGGGFTLSNLSVAFSGIYRHGFITSIQLAVIASVLPGVAGLLIAYAIHTAERGGVLRRAVTTASGVFANFGGVPLAFLFIATLGNTGLATTWLNDIGINIYTAGFNLYALSGIAVVYMYFQIPLMVLVITPALSGLRPAWREAAENMGAGSWQYWRYVGGPVLLPSFLGAVLLLFGSSLSAYATADALTNGTIPLTSIQIGSFLSGNVIAGHENVGKALGLGLVIVVTLVMGIYIVLQRKATRWLR